MESGACAIKYSLPGSETMRQQTTAQDNVTLSTFIFVLVQSLNEAHPL